MADYWKSNDRYFCEMCNCWMADNKISRQLHEQGGRHKGNVQNRLNNISKSNREKEKMDKVFKETLDTMNHGAMESMFADIARDPSLAKRYGLRMSADAQRQIEERAAARAGASSGQKPSSSGSGGGGDGVGPRAPSVAEKADSHAEMVGAAYSLLTGDVAGGRAVSAAVVRPPSPPPPPLPASLWREAHSADGQLYFWNTVSNETSWTRPPEPQPNRFVPPPFAVGAGLAAVPAAPQENLPSEVQQAKSKITFFHKQKLQDLQKKASLAPEGSSGSSEAAPASAAEAAAVSSYAQSIELAEALTQPPPAAPSLNNGVESVDTDDVTEDDGLVAPAEERENWRAPALGKWQPVPQKARSAVEQAGAAARAGGVDLQLPAEAWDALKEPTAEEGWVMYEEDVPQLCISEKKVTSLKRDGDTRDSVAFSKRRCRGAGNRSLRNRDLAD